MEVGVVVLRMHGPRIGRATDRRERVALMARRAARSVAIGESDVTSWSQCSMAYSSARIMRALLRKEKHASTVRCAFVASLH
jgi:hypothetical protein